LEDAGGTRKKSGFSIDKAVSSYYNEKGANGARGIGNF
jgi:hypothetical protein